GRGPAVRRYWDPLEHALAPRLDVSEEEAVEGLEELLTRSVRLQMIADVPLGAFLSGGGDASTIVALMAEAGGEVKTFTVGFEEDRYDESAAARAVAEHLGTSHVTERLSLHGALELATELAASFGEPFGDPSALPTRLVSSVARRHVTVSLSGDGGDELFGGYAVYERLARLERTLALARPLRSTLLPALTRLPGRPGRPAPACGGPGGGPPRWSRPRRAGRAGRAAGRGGSSATREAARGSGTGTTSRPRRCAA